MGTRILFTLALFFISQLCLAGSSSHQKELDIEASIEKLDKINYLPNMLPVILENQDFIGLTEEQVSTLEKWRRENRKPMLAKMQLAARKRIEIKEAAISPTVSSARLQQMQNDIFRLQREILEYKLSCRDHVVQIFNDENWIGFFMVLSDKDIGVSVPENFAER